MRYSMTFKRAAFAALAAVAILRAGQQHAGGAEHDRFILARPAVAVTGDDGGCVPVRGGDKHSHGQGQVG